MNNVNLCLCGSTFFNILLTIKKNDVTDSDCLFKLLNIIDSTCLVGRDSRDLVAPTSKLRHCKSEQKKSKYLSFGISGVYEGFKDKIINHHSTLVKDLDTFFDEYSLDNELNRKTVVQMILALISCDSIADNNSFYVYGVGDLSKKELLDLYSNNEIPFYDFISCIVYYVYANFSLSENDKYGRPTVELWGDFSNIASKIPNFSSFSDIKVDFAKDSSVPSQNPNMSGFSKVIGNKFNHFKSYTDWILSNYKNKKTLLYKQPEPFDNFYVCNDLECSYNNIWDEPEVPSDTISEATTKKLLSYNYHMFLVGSAGVGKSMMMQHLLLDAASNYESYGKLPIFLELKRYDDTVDIKEWAFSMINAHCVLPDYDILDDMLRAGDFIFILDGMDEIKQQYKESFETKMTEFIDSFSDCQFIISTRENENLYPFTTFSIYTVLPFDLDKAVKLVRKLRFRPEDPEFKENFIGDIQSKLWASHRDFVSSPLLLTIMLMTYDRFSKIPEKIHEFYRKAYMTLAEEHDATKGSSIDRQMKTGLSAEDFLDYLAEFSARTYKDGLYDEYRKEDIKKIFEAMNIVKNKQPSFTYKDFIYDMEANLCLFFEEGDIIHWSHRSFQEYFCAYYLSKQHDRNLGLIGNTFFNFKRPAGSHNLAFGMLYDIIPGKVEEYILLPYFEELFERDLFSIISKETFDNYFKRSSDYWKILYYLYGRIIWVKGTVPQQPSHLTTEFFYNFFIQKYKIEHSTDYFTLPCISGCIWAEYGYVNYSYVSKAAPDMWTIKNIDHINKKYLDIYGIPEICGEEYHAYVKDLFETPEKYISLIKAIEDESFPLYQEYLDICNHLERIRNNRNKEHSDSSDIFDLLL